MTARGQGEDSPGDSGARAAVPARAKVRSEPGTAGESGVMGAADTAVAMSSATGELHETQDKASAASHLMASGAREDLVGTMLLGRYSVLRKIGQGGMGAVYEATHT